MSPPAVPFFCPYCGEQELEPHGDVGTWYCGSCDRRFTMRFEGVGAE